MMDDRLLDLGTRVHECEEPFDRFDGREQHQMEADARGLNLKNLIHDRAMERPAWPPSVQARVKIRCHIFGGTAVASYMVVEGRDASRCIA